MKSNQNDDIFINFRCAPCMHCFIFIDSDLPRPRRRLSELLYKTAFGLNPPRDNDIHPIEKDWHLMFHRSPLEFLGNADNSQVNGVKLVINRLEVITYL